ncbi:MAG TPA: Trm112 family protein [Candidatus Sabulitectum sp.]|nr:Trm112 family protein [Candidatus Sabulitectum sp.]HPF31903.1 Trm112 family protein [Candidatus Sabulitectum sp.]HPJ28241.1 Trm112 family protein [Candidatus Sabulitectum sp.]HPR22729.1 Trm112 family protein [Candidatus Sabulitectum sp.]
MLDQRLLDILVCPKCKGDLEYRTQGDEMLICGKCRLGYPVKDGIPVMLVEEAVRTDAGE